ncbi:MAG TPA: hypothetical protein VD929_05130 [Caulobacteraceae bacterium]|nr:hypothetical protein [Caulobacteraceae bacterium]
MHRLRLFAAALAAAPLLSGCVIVAADTDGQDRPDPAVSMPTSAPYESLHGVLFDERGFSARLNSNGCTSKENVTVDVKRDRLLTRLAVRRLQPDTCNSLRRDAVWLTWSLQELGLRQDQIVEIDNAYAPW